MTIKFGIETVTTSGGSVVPFSKTGITLIVGPNNSGKSTFLREVEKAVRLGNTQAKTNYVVCREITCFREGDKDAQQTFLTSNTKRFLHNNGQTYLRTLGVNTTEGELMAHWANVDTGFQTGTPLYCFLADTEGRLSAANPAQVVNLNDDPLTHPIHSLQDDDEIERRFSGHFKAAFGSELILNRGAGATVPLHMGKDPTKAAGEDRVSKNYLRALSTLPKVNEQGDGIRSFVGTLLAAFAMKRFVTLLDEPEAFLHPPQARLLGGLLSKEHKENQLLISTHSGDVLRGVLDTNSKALKVLRITRQDDKNHIHALDQDDIKQLWADPILRFSNVLDGLFHEQVVLCESDVDCRFYSAILDMLVDKSNLTMVRDTLFTSSGGKDRMPVIIRALSKSKVNVRVAADFDLLSDPKKFQEIFVALGGDWTQVETDYTSVKSSLERKTPPLSASQVIDKIEAVLNQVAKSTAWTDDNKEDIRSAMKATSAWSAAKESGKAAIPSGDASAAIERILTKVNSLGLFLVPTGELESFDRTVGGHATRWLTKVLEKDIANAPEFEAARAFVRALCGL